MYEANRHQLLKALDALLRSSGLILEMVRIEAVKEGTRPELYTIRLGLAVHAEELA